MSTARVILIGAIMCLASAALANRQVQLDRDGNVAGVTWVYGKNAKVDHTKNQYSDEEWDSFGITSEAPYIIKDGAVWRDMTAAETNAINATIKQEALDEAKADAYLDALMQVVADAVAGNLKTKAEIEAAFKNAVDPKKVKKDK